MTRLHDIQGLDPVGIWPLAPGWWLILGLLLAGALARAVLRHGLPSLRGTGRRRWRRDARRRLHDLRARIRVTDAKAAAVELSELLRRIAMARCGREACAGLSGEAWLDWLSQHDPRRFDWRARGRLLLELPYRPPDDTDYGAQMHELVDAALAWTSADGAGRRAAEFRE